MLQYHTKTYKIHLVLCDVIKGLHLHKFVEISKKINKRFSLLNEKNKHTEVQRIYINIYSYNYGIHKYQRKISV